MSESSRKRGLVLVTGGSGYIAGYCIAELLNDGWSVRSTVRSSAKTKAVRESIADIASKASEIEFVEADLNSDAAWDNAAIGAQYVLHVASPVPVTDPKNDDELVRPARDGTLRVLKAARDAGVKRVVMTSSISAIIYGPGVREKPFTEEDWTDETNRRNTSPYDGPRPSPSARRGRGWRRKAGDSNSLPSAPAWFSAPCWDRIIPLRLKRLRSCWIGSIPVLPRFGFNVVDVRDIARLHVLAMATPEAVGQRFIGSGDFYWMCDVAKILKQGLGDGAKKVPSIAVPDFVARVAGLFDPIVRGRLYELGKKRPVSSEKAKRVLGWRPRPVTETVLDTAGSLQASGLV
jgi:dihydroflavonol-4-reductase